VAYLGEKAALRLAQASAVFYTPLALFQGTARFSGLGDQARSGQEGSGAGSGNGAQEWSLRATEGHSAVNYCT
jgi:hypothetical protein